MTRNIVLICLDAVRKDYFDRYAPRLQSLADVSFEQCRAASSCSVPSHASMLCGELPSEHGVHSTNVDYTRLDHDETITSDLPNHRTIGVSANEWVSPEFGFDLHFDEFYRVSPRRRFPDGLDVRPYIHSSDSRLRSYMKFLGDALAHDAPIKSLGNGVLAQLYNVSRQSPLPQFLDDGAEVVSKQMQTRAAQTEEPFFLFANFMDAHSPQHHVYGYDRSLHSAANSWDSAEFDLDVLRYGDEDTVEQYEEFIATYRDLYAASIDYLDRKVSTLVEEIRADTDRETTVIITADHGENLCYAEDRYLFGHVSSLSEALLHVPFSIINPPGEYRPEESQYFSHLELRRLIASFGRGEVSDVFSDRIVAELIGVGGNPEAMTEAEYRYWHRMIRAAYEDETKYVWDSVGNRHEVEIDHSIPSKEERVPTRGTSHTANRGADPVPSVHESADDIDIPEWAIRRFESEIKSAKKKVQTEKSNEPLETASEETIGRLEDLGYL